MANKAQTIVDNGLLKSLVGLDKLEEYWQHMLHDFPDHPAAKSPCSSVPISLYGTLKCIVHFVDFKLCDS